eukprot:TRINITY_DN7477_c0_g1_i5.p1 TRINITY_DN7477_c0_g1~~TRINITY_DN7477_c0_g1_i5.p1  ORF type:complete len:143 (+),score=6.02 TRINITY_DN7477_c0_g1_i5:167-595(+)
METNQRVWETKAQIYSNTFWSYSIASNHWTEITASGRPNSRIGHGVVYVKSEGRGSELQRDGCEGTYAHSGGEHAHCLWYQRACQHTRQHETAESAVNGSGHRGCERFPTSGQSPAVGDYPSQFLLDIASPLMLVGRRTDRG